jgi:hypothetical protein
MADVNYWLDGTKPTLREALAEWEDWDVAGFHLGICLGLWENTPEAWLANKHRFWTNNGLGTQIVEFLYDWTTLGILERNGDEQYRWRGQEG